MHQHNTENFLELLKTGRHCWLSDAARFRCSSEMTFLCEREKEFKFVDQKNYSGATVPLI